MFECNEHSSTYMINNIFLHIEKSIWVKIDFYIKINPRHLFVGHRKKNPRCFVHVLRYSTYKAHYYRKYTSFCYLADTAAWWQNVQLLVFLLSCKDIQTDLNLRPFTVCSIIVTNKSFIIIHINALSLPCTLIWVDVLENVIDITLINSKLCFKKTLKVDPINFYKVQSHCIS